MSTNSYQINDTLFLNRQPLSKAAPPSAQKTAPPTNHIVVIDCSGSMYYDLPKIREQLKKRLPKLLGDQDTISIIWFSGRGQFGVLLEEEPVASLADLDAVNKAIDRWLKPVCLTGFKEPIQEAHKLVGRISKNRPNTVFSLFFMSDGCDNQWNRAEILDAVEVAADGLAAATFVEYGYYADRPLLTAMAERSGGQLIFSEGFEKYEPVFEDILQKKPTGAPRVEMKLGADPLMGFAWTMRDGDLTTYGCDDGGSGIIVHVPEDTVAVWYVSEQPAGTVQDSGYKDNALGAIYAAMSLYSVRMRPEIIFPLLRVTGDVRFIDAFSTCFGKQKYSQFMDEAKAAAFDEGKRLVDGCDHNKVPADDAYTVLDLLKLLASDEDNRVFLDHPEFEYNRISRGRIDADLVLSDEEQEKVDALTEEMGKTRNAAKIRTIQAKIDEITANKKPLKFEVAEAPDGYPITSLVFNEDRPNVSFKVRQEGTVDLSKRLPKEHTEVPEVFPTFRFRNFAVVSDGLVNISRLPVRVTADTAKHLAAELPYAAFTEGKPGQWFGVIDLDPLPVINRKMVKSASALDLFETQFALAQARAAQKVYKGYRDERVPKKESATFKVDYGNEAAEWLKEQGFTDYSGFNPRMVADDVSDYYMGKALKVKLKGLSSLPKVADVRERITASKNQTAGGALMAPFVEEVEAKLRTGISDDDFIAWIDEKAEDAITESRRLIFNLAENKFAVIVGQTWFTEFESIDENEMDFTVGDNDLHGTVVMQEVEIKI